MISRPYIIHQVSTTQPTGQQLGDEWYNPTTNQLTKTLAVNGNVVTATQVVTAIGGNAISTQFTSTGTGADQMPVGTTAQRPATPTAGMTRFNTTLGIAEYYTGTEWVKFSFAGITPNVDVLVVAGGGGGGWDWAGGGGAGGAINNTTYSVTPGTPISISIGGGGSAPASGGVPGGTGSNTTFGIITANGGGGGGSDQGGDTGVGGGSGGGGAIDGAGGSGTVGQGLAGGTGNRGDSLAGGGGGGKTQNGFQSIGDGRGGKGGDGILFYGTYYAGGGGGGRNGGTAATPGLGGGGNGSSAGSNGTAGATNTGGGGGGGAAGPGLPGGSGVVVVAYSDNFAPAASTTGTVTYTVINSIRRYVFTTSGSITF